MKSIIRNIIIAVVIIVLGFVGYKFFFAKPQASTGSLQTTQGTATGPAPVSTSSSVDSTSTIGQDFLAQLLSVKSITLNISILSNKAFLLLQDFNRPIPADTNPGRTDPFAPIGTDGSIAAVQVSTSNPSSITSTTSTLNGSLLVTDPSASRWFQYGTTATLGTMTTPKAQPTPGAFAETISGLTPNTTYYVQAGASVGGVTVMGNLVTWKTALSPTGR